VPSNGGLETETCQYCSILYTNVTRYNGTQPGGSARNANSVISTPDAECADGIIVSTERIETFHAESDSADGRSVALSIARGRISNFVSHRVDVRSID